MAAALAARDALFFALMWATGLRAADTLRILTQNIDAFKGTPEGGKGWYLHLMGSKTERTYKQSRMFKLMDPSAITSPMAAYACWVQALDNLGLRPQPGHLFRRLSEMADGSVVQGGQATWADMELRFQCYAKAAGLPTSITMHSFHGSHAAEADAAGVPKPEVCTEMHWQEETRAYYVDGRPVISYTDLTPGCRPDPSKPADAGKPGAASGTVVINTKK